MERQYITFEQAKQLFLQGCEVWYEDEQLTQKDIDENPDEYDGYFEGDWLPTVFCSRLGDKIENMQEDVKYFIGD